MDSISSSLSSVSVSQSASGLDLTLPARVQIRTISGLLELPHEEILLEDVLAKDTTIQSISDQGGALWANKRVLPVPSGESILYALPKTWPKALVAKTIDCQNGILAIRSLSENQEKIQALLNQARYQIAFLQVIYRVMKKSSSAIAGDWENIKQNLQKAKEEDDKDLHSLKELINFSESLPPELQNQHQESYSDLIPPDQVKNLIQIFKDSMAAILDSSQRIDLLKQKSEQLSGSDPTKSLLDQKKALDGQLKENRQNFANHQQNTAQNLGKDQDILSASDVLVQKANHLFADIESKGIQCVRQYSQFRQIQKDLQEDFDTIRAQLALHQKRYDEFIRNGLMKLQVLIPLALQEMKIRSQVNQRIQYHINIEEERRREGLKAMKLNSTPVAWLNEHFPYLCYPARSQISIGFKDIGIDSSIKVDFDPSKINSKEDEKEWKIREEELIKKEKSIAEEKLNFEKEQQQLKLLEAEIQQLEESITKVCISKAETQQLLTKVLEEKKRCFQDAQRLREESIKQEGEIQRLKKILDEENGFLEALSGAFLGQSS